jgi:hypothetical protein
MAYQIAAIRKVAMGLSGVEEGVSCAGTALERSAFKVKKKTFLFLGTAKDGAIELRLKLADSVTDAEKRGFAAGAHGWVLLRLEKTTKLPKGLLEKWIGESFRAMGGK